MLIAENIETIAMTQTIDNLIAILLESVNNFILFILWNSNFIHDGNGCVCKRIICFNYCGYFRALDKIALECNQINETFIKQTI